MRYEAAFYTMNSPSNRLQELRVAHQELRSGNQQGQVFLRLSPEAVAFPMERHVAEARVSRQLQDAINESPVEASVSKQK